MRLSILALIAAVILLAAFVVLQFRDSPSEAPGPRVTHQPTPPRPEEEPVVRYPIPDEAGAPAAESRPDSAASDETGSAVPGSDQEGEEFIRTLLADLVPQDQLFALLLPEDFIPRLVVIIDALPRKNIPRQHLPLKPPRGRFQVTGPEDAPVIGAENYDRYTPYVRLTEAIPTDTLAATYFRLYPLFQEVYRKMGYPRGYFNDRLIEVLDHLLATPELSEPIPVEPHVNRYIFRNEDLESRSAGQKILLRMGPDNARRVKARLQALRDALVTASEKSLETTRP